MIQCKHCGRRNGSSNDVARLAGWRMFSGKSMTGKDLDDVICPHCAGTAPVEEPEPTWRVRCNTCEWEWEDEYGEGALTAKEAYNLAYDHECEPWIEVQRPGDERWLPRRALRKDGSLDEDAAAPPLQPTVTPP